MGRVRRNNCPKDRGRQSGRLLPVVEMCSVRVVTDIVKSEKKENKIAGDEETE